MRQLKLVRNNDVNLAECNLFDNRTSGGSVSQQMREQEQRDELEKLARELAEMLDKLDEQIRSQPERASVFVAEYAGLFEKAVDELCDIRDIDEAFGCRYRRRSPLAAMAERLEKGLNYLVGVFSVVSTSNNIGRYNWQLVQRDIQEVLAVSRAIASEPTAKKEAA